jgi:hypothetical protein
LDAVLPQRKRLYFCAKNEQMSVFNIYFLLLKWFEKKKDHISQRMAFFFSAEAWKDCGLVEIKNYKYRHDFFMRLFWF